LDELLLIAFRAFSANHFADKNITPTLSPSVSSLWFTQSGLARQPDNLISVITAEKPFLQFYRPHNRDETPHVKLETSNIRLIFEKPILSSMILLKIFSKMNKQALSH
jgi:hypothetical protein